MRDGLRFATPFHQLGQRLPGPYIRRSMTAFDYLGIALLIAFVAANWFAPRRFGVAGMICVHLTLLVAYFGLAAIALRIGRYEYDGALSIIGLALQAFLLNCLLLPIALMALWMRRRQPGAGRGFPVDPPPPQQ